MEIIKYLAIVVAVFAGLYLAWKLFEVIDRYYLGRQEQARRDMHGESYCVHTADGSVYTYRRKPGEERKPPFFIGGQTQLDEKPTHNVNLVANGDLPEDVRSTVTNKDGGL